MMINKMKYKSDYNILKLVIIYNVSVHIKKYLSIKGGKSMISKNYNMKKTISINNFVSEFGENFSKHIKRKLLELDDRTVLTRKEKPNVLDLKHVEHIKYSVGSNKSEKAKKEYIYARFIVNDGQLFFSEKCSINNDSMQSPNVEKIYNALNSNKIIVYDDVGAKLLDDSNIDYVVDSILEVCPNLSQRYLDIVEKMKRYEKK